MKNAFIVIHFVGPVTYAGKDLLIKNKDPVSEDLMVMLQRSKNELIAQLFAKKSATQAAMKGKKDTRFQGVCAKFQKQLEELLRLVGYSHMHFVRCIKPNLAKTKQV